MQIFTELLDDGLRAEAWAWLGEGTPEWEWSAANRPPLSQTAKREERQAGVNLIIERALSSGGKQAERIRGGIVNGVHYLQLSEPIKQLKREGRLRDALVLCYMAIEGAEAEALYDGREPAPAYTKHAAIIHKKLKERDQEIAVLERWLAACPPGQRDGSGIQQRLNKLIQQS